MPRVPSLVRLGLAGLVIVPLAALSISYAAQDGNPLAPRKSAKDNPLAKRDPFAGRFEGEELRVEITPRGSEYEGSLTLGDQSFPLRAKRDGDSLAGSFTAGGEEYEFRTTLDGETLTVESGGSTYKCRRIGRGAADPREDGADSGDEETSVSADVKPPTPLPPGLVMETYKHPLGYVFQHPKGWQFQPSEGGLIIIPNDAAKDAQGQPLELFILSGEDATGVTRPDQPEVGAFFEMQIGQLIPGTRRKGEAKKLDCLLGPGAIFEFEGKNPQGKTIRVTAYVTLHRGNGIFLLHLSEADLHAKREAIARTMFSSFGFEKGETDAALVGDWTREETEGSSFDPITGGVGASTRINYRFQEDGTCWVGSNTRFFGTVEGAGGSVSIDDPGGRGNSTRGTWGVREGKLSILWEGGGADVFEYRVFDHQGSPALKLQVPGAKKPKYFTKR